MPLYFSSNAQCTSLGSSSFVSVSVCVCVCVCVPDALSLPLQLHNRTPPGDSGVGDDYNLPHWINHRQALMTGASKTRFSLSVLERLVSEQRENIFFIITNNCLHEAAVT